MTDDRLLRANKLMDRNHENIKAQLSVELNKRWPNIIKYTSFEIVGFFMTIINIVQREFKNFIRITQH